MSEIGIVPYDVLIKEYQDSLRIRGAISPEWKSLSDEFETLTLKADPVDRVSINASAQHRGSIPEFLQPKNAKTAQPVSYVVKVQANTTSGPSWSVRTVTPNMDSFGDPKFRPNDQRTGDYDIPALASMFGVDHVDKYVAVGPDLGRPKTHVTSTDIQKDIVSHTSKIAALYITGDDNWQCGAGGFAPWKTFEGETVSWSVLTFDRHMAAREPFEVPSRFTTHSEKAEKATLFRYGIAHKMESTAMRLAKGRLIWTYQQAQLFNATLVTCMTMAETALLNAPKDASDIFEMLRQPATRATHKARRLMENLLYDCVRKRDGMQILTNYWKQVYKFRGQPTNSTTMVIPSECAQCSVGLDDNRLFAKTGIPRSKMDEWENWQVPGVSKVILHNAIKLSSWEWQNMFWTWKCHGGYASLDVRTLFSLQDDDGADYKTSHASFQRYFDSSDNDETTYQQDMFDHCLLYVPETLIKSRNNPSGGLDHSKPWHISAYGVDYFGKVPVAAGAPIDAKDGKEEKGAVARAAPPVPGVPMRIKNAEEWYQDSGLPQRFIDIVTKKFKALKDANSPKLKVTIPADPQNRFAELRDHVVGMATPLHVDTFFRKCWELNIPVFIPMLDVSPNRMYRAATAAGYINGAANTLCKLPNYSLSFSGKINTVEGHMTFHATTVVTDKAKVIVTDNVYVDGYGGGNGQSWWGYHDRDRYIQDPGYKKVGNNKYEGPPESRMAIALRPNEAVPEQGFDISGRAPGHYRSYEISRSPNGADDCPYDYSTWAYYVHHWKIVALADPTETKYNHFYGPRGKQNTWVDQDRQFMLMRRNGVIGWIAYIPNCGKFGINVYPGCGIVRNGHGNYADQSYQNFVPHMPYRTAIGAAA